MHGERADSFYRKIGQKLAIGEDGTANLLLMVFVMAAVSFADTSSSSYVCAGEVGRAG